MPRPSQEVMDRLRTLYIQRATHMKALDGSLSEIAELLRQQEDYQKWLDGDGLEKNLPSWIHECTGGRPVYQGIRPAVRRKPKPKQKEAEGMSSEDADLFKSLMKGYK